jgi:hypothetical protein
MPEKRHQSNHAIVYSYQRTQHCVTFKEFVIEEIIVNTPLTLENAIIGMLATHPAASEIEQTALLHCLETSVLCSMVCRLCADACLAEEGVAHLVSCIQSNGLCAAICHSTAQVLAHYAGTDLQTLYLQLETCRAACEACAAICAGHSDTHEHCRICATACQDCANACTQMMGRLPLIQ